jgi:LysR family transcriptional regulator for metE and metH
LKRFHQKFPRIEVSIDANSTSRPVDALLAGQLDIAILSSPPKNKGLIVTPICEDELVIAVAADHALARSKYIRPRDLVNETVLVYPPREESTLVQKYLVPAGIEPKGVLELPLTEAMIEMVASGLGVALLPRWAVTPHVKAGRLAARPLTGRGLWRTWYAATLRDQPASPHLCEFVQLLSQPHPGEAWPGLSKRRAS